MDNKKDKSKDKNKAVNDKLKKMAKLDLQKKLFFGKKNNSVFETFETKESNLQMTNNIGSYMVNFAMGNVKKWWKPLALIGICGIVVVNTISACITTVGGISDEVTPKLPVEDVESLKQAMRSLDQATGKRLYQDFTITGENEDWKAVLSLLIGYHKNDLSNFAESLTGSGGNWQEGLISIDGLNFIKTHEGFSSVPYNIGDGTMTIGYGTTQKYEPEAYRQLAPRCTEAQASTVMERNIRQNYASTVLFYVNKSGRDLSDFKQHHFDALVSFQYNEGSIQDETFWRMFKNGASYEAVANQMATTKISYGGGVVTRRKAEAKLFSTGYYPPVNIYDYGAGRPIVTSGSSMTGVSNSNLSKFYNAINEVSSDHKTLKRKSFKEALNNVGLDDEQKEIAEFLYEMDSWEMVFGEEFDFSFNLNGTYLSGGIMGDYAGLSIPRQEILSIAQQICDLNIYYLWGGREYNMNKPINQVNRMDCSGFTGYLMAKVFGATYYNGTDTYHQINSCYEVPADQALPGDIVFNHSLGHTLIYAGEKDGRKYFYHAPETGKVIQCSTYHNNITFHRLKNVDYDAVYDRRW
jgi:GH24 family phage-related lysozyme (muramidase)